MFDFHLLFRDQYDRRLYVANPSSTLCQWVRGEFEPEATLRPANANDLMAALTQNEVELLDLLKAGGYTDAELESVAQSLGLSLEQIQKYQQAEDAGEIDSAENYYLTELTAAMMEEIIRAKGAVNTPVILQASISDLRIWEGNYDDMLREKFAELCKVQDTITGGDYTSNSRWCEDYAVFHKWAGYLWQCRARLKVNIFSGSLKRGEAQAV